MSLYIFLKDVNLSTQASDMVPLIEEGLGARKKLASLFGKESWCLLRGGGKSYE